MQFIAFYTDRPISRSTVSKIDRKFRENGHDFPQKVNMRDIQKHNHWFFPFFYEKLNGERYLRYLRHELMPVFANLFPNTNNLNLPIDICFQQDGALPSYARDVRQFLNNCFPER